MPSPEWLYEEGIGEARAALVADGRIVAARIELADDAYRNGEIARGRVTAITSGRRRALVALERGQVSLEPLPAGVNEGMAVTVVIVREAIPEPGRTKPPRARISDCPPAPAPPLRDRLDGAPVRTLAAHARDELEEAGWSELLDEAATGTIAFPGGTLRMSPTPAMTLFDVDGDLAPEPLALAAARAVAEAILRHDIGGSIGIDFPTIAGKAARQAVAAVLDGHLPQPFERTAVNGFGFLQLIRPRPRASLPELIRADPIGAAARAALRTIERVPATAPNAHRLHAAVRDRIAGAWHDALVRRTGRVPIFD